MSKLKTQRKRVKTGKVGKSLVPRVGTAPNGLPNVQIHLLITRQSGDTERYLLAEVQSMLFAIEYRRRLARVPVPKQLVSKDLREAA